MNGFDVDGLVGCGSVFDLIEDEAEDWLKCVRFELGLGDLCACGIKRSGDCFLDIDHVKIDDAVVAFLYGDDGVDC